MKDELEYEMPAEVDFSNGVRGKYLGGVLRKTIYVALDEDVSHAFKTREEVNTALRMLIKTAEATVARIDQKAS